MELKLLQAIHLKINSEGENNLKKEIIIPNVKVNKFPKVFKNGYGYELFRYLVQVDDEEISSAWGQKYFDLFKDEKLIKNTAKKINFIRFLRKEYHIEFYELDFRASYNEEADFLKEIKKDFEKKYGLKQC